MKPLAWKKVLVVDDSPLVRERLIALLLEVEGVEVAETDSAEKAIAMLPEVKPAVVVLDLSMPNGSGFLVLQALQHSKVDPLTIVLTNFAHEPYRKRCLKLGADYFFDKSTEFEAVKALLENLPQPAEVPI